MCKFKPFNKHILVKKIQKPEIKNSGVLIPEDIKTVDKERYGQVKFVRASSDCEIFLLNLNVDRESWLSQTGTMDDVFTTSAKNSGHISLVVDKRMVEEITIHNEQYHIVHQNYVVGVIDE